MQSGATDSHVRRKVSGLAESYAIYRNGSIKENAKLTTTAAKDSLVLVIHMTEVVSFAVEVNKRDQYTMCFISPQCGKPPKFHVLCMSHEETTHHGCACLN